MSILKLLLSLFPDINRINVISEVLIDGGITAGVQPRHYMNTRAGEGRRSAGLPGPIQLLEEEPGGQMWR